jgi:hypothetical protein
MDAFESLIASLLEREGFWVRSGVKVELTKEEKRIIGRPSSPRWELDLVAYKGGINELRVVECKSYLDSRGVSIQAVDGSDDRYASRFKLFKELPFAKLFFDVWSRRCPTKAQFLRIHKSLCVWSLGKSHQNATGCFCVSTSRRMTGCFGTMSGYEIV